jgi:hypothetical protein
LMDFATFVLTSLSDLEVGGWQSRSSTHSRSNKEESQ